MYVSAPGSSTFQLVVSTHTSLCSPALLFIKGRSLIRQIPTTYLSSLLGIAPLTTFPLQLTQGYHLRHTDFQHNFLKVTENSPLCFCFVFFFKCRRTSQTALRWSWNEMQCWRTHTDASSRSRGQTCWRHDCGWSLMEKKDWTTVAWPGSGSSSCPKRCSTRTTGYSSIPPRESLFLYSVVVTCSFPTFGNF